MSVLDTILYFLVFLMLSYQIAVILTLHLVSDFHDLSFQVNYSFIAKVETLDTDWSTMRKLVGSTLPDILLPHLNTLGGNYQDYVDQLSSTQLQGIYRKYQMDFEIFGYEL